MNKKPTRTLTHAQLTAWAAQPPDKRTDNFDAATPGLCITVGKTTLTWYYFARVDGKLTRLRFGHWPAVSLAEARRRSGEVDAQVRAGTHPKAEQARAKAATSQQLQADIALIVENIACTWADQHRQTVKPTTWRDYGRYLDGFVAAFAGRDIRGIRRGELVRHLDQIKSKSAVGANQAASVLRQLFAYAQDRFDLDTQPAANLSRPAKPPRRSRVLTRDEVRALWLACDVAGYPYGHALQFALATGQRIGEVGALAWSDIDGDYWLQRQNKTDKRIDVALNAHAKAVLACCPRFLDDEDKPLPNVFSSTGGETGLRRDVWNHALARHITPRMQSIADQHHLTLGAERWTAHDLRRTVRTGLTGWSDVTPDTAERVLNHAVGGLRAIYDHADYRPHVTSALRTWSQELDLILQGLPCSRELVATLRPHENGRLVESVR